MGSKTKHTPWSMALTHIFDAEGRGVAKVKKSSDGELIVRAVNAHDDLLAALERLRLEAQHFVDARVGEQFLRGAISDAVAAIAKARGE